MAPVTTAPVLVSGVTGYIGSWVAAELLRRGYSVRGTARNPEKAERIRTAIIEHAGSDRLEVVSADLMDADSWHRAMDGVTHVLHVASPFPIALPDHPDDLIVPAREGTLHVLRAATESGVQRVVVTSSMAAVVYGLTSTPAQPMTETRWTDPEGNDDHTPYILSKFYAERAAWDFVRDTPGAPDLATVNPGAVLGPLLADNASDSLLMVTKMLNGEFPGVPKLGFEVVDVRDVADLHIRAMEAPEAAGERFLAVAGFRTMREIADVLREAVPERAKKLPKVTLPDWVVRVFARFDADTRGALSELGKRRIASSEKAQRVLGWAPRSPDEAVRASARDVVSRGLIG